MSIDTRMDKMQPVVLEKTGFDFREERKLLHFLGFSILEVSDAKKGSLIYFLDCCSTYAEIAIGTRYEKFSRLFCKEIEFD